MTRPLMTRPLIALFGATLPTFARARGTETEGARARRPNRRTRETEGRQARRSCAGRCAVSCRTRVNARGGDVMNAPCAGVSSGRVGECALHTGRL